MLEQGVMETQNGALELNGTNGADLEDGDGSVGGCSLQMNGARSAEDIEDDGVDNNEGSSTDSGFER